MLPSDTNEQQQQCRSNTKLCKYTHDQPGGRLQVCRYWGIRRSIRMIPTLHDPWSSSAIHTHSLGRSAHRMLPRTCGSAQACAWAHPDLGAQQWVAPTPLPRGCRHPVIAGPCHQLTSQPRRHLRCSTPDVWTHVLPSPPSRRAHRIFQESMCEVTQGNGDPAAWCTRPARRQHKSGQEHGKNRALQPQACLHTRQPAQERENTEQQPTPADARGPLQRVMDALTALLQTVERTCK